MAEVLNTKNFDEETAKGVVLVDFYADWCGPCKMIAPLIDKLAEEVTDAKIVKVNLDESPEIANKFRIKSIPTFIVFKDGDVVNKHVGAVSDKNFFLKLIKDAKQMFVIFLDIDGVLNCENAYKGGYCKYKTFSQK